MVQEDANWYFLYFLGPFEGYCCGSISYEHSDYEKVHFSIKKFGPKNIDGACSGIKIPINMSLNKKSS